MSQTKIHIEMRNSSSEGMVRVSASVTGKIDVRGVMSNAYCVTDEAPELMAEKELAEYRA
ncbi:MAG: hypothetical protein GXY61_09500 [Lentisphaerae bacterium]|jgi:hypothetical protein|nr:hypothetical protein [Lentisphaerota bacterium]